MLGTLPSGLPRLTSLDHTSGYFSMIPFSTNWSGKWHMLENVFCLLLYKQMHFTWHIDMAGQWCDTFYSNTLNERHFNNLYSKFISKKYMNMGLFITATGPLPILQLKWAKNNYLMLLPHEKYIIISVLYTSSQMLFIECAYTCYTNIIYFIQIYTHVIFISV